MKAQIAYLVMSSKDDAPLMDVVMNHGDYEDVLACCPRYSQETAENKDKHNADVLVGLAQNHKSGRVKAAIYILNSTSGCIPMLKITPLMGWVEVLREREKEPGKFSRIGYMV